MVIFESLVLAHCGHAWLPPANCGLACDRTLTCCTAHDKSCWQVAGITVAGSADISARSCCILQLRFGPVKHCMFIFVPGVLKIFRAGCQHKQGPTLAQGRGRRFPALLAGLCGKDDMHLSLHDKFDRKGATHLCAAACKRRRSGR